MKVVNGRHERMRRALKAKLKEAERGRSIPAEKVFRELKVRSRLEAKIRQMPKPYVRSCSLPRGYLFDFKDARGIGVPRSLRLV